MTTTMSDQAQGSDNRGQYTHLDNRECEKCETKRKHRHKRVRDKMAEMRYSVPLEEYRKMYKNEIQTLWRELEEFRKSCQQQIEKQKMLLEEQKRKTKEVLKETSSKETVPDLPGDLSTELKKLEKNMSFLERNQGLLDKERQLVEKEELLAHRQHQLSDYEKEVEEAEQMLTRRQSICDIRSKEVEHLNEDLLHMKHDIIDTVDLLASDTPEPSQNGTTDNLTDVTINSPEASVKARRHWTLARRHMIDKVSLLEGTVQRYRTQLASATASVTAKDLMIQRLNKELSGFQEELTSKQYRIKQLESQLSISIEEKRRSEKNFDMLMEELQNIDLGASSKLMHSPEVSPKHNGNLKHKLTRKQYSTFSFFGGDTGDKSGSEKGVSASHFKDNFRRKLLSLHSSPHGTPKRRSRSHSELNGGVRHETGEADKDEEDRDFEDKSRRASNDNRHRTSTSSDPGSKACIVM